MYLHIVMNSFEHDTRVLKACRVSAEAAVGESVLVAALGGAELPCEESINERIMVWRPRLRSRSWPKNLFVQTFKYVEWLWRITSRMRAERPSLIHAHSLTALPVGVAVKWVTGASLLYDAHELETEIDGIGSTEQKLSRWLEAFCLRWVDQMLTVCDSIADWYVDTYSVRRPFIVRNIPDWSQEQTARSDILRNVHNIPEGELIYLYQGALFPGRGVEKLLEVFSGLELNRHMVFMGYGSLEAQVREAASRLKNVHFQKAVLPDEVAHYTSSADVGFCLIADTCLSFYYSLPNKLFEYLLAGLPLIVNDLPEQRVIVDKYRCGWIAPESKNELADLIESIDRKSLDQKRQGVSLSRQDFSWDAEAEILRGAYSAVLCGRDSVDCSKDQRQS